MDILILAAGFGTRLYPLTYNLPKALIKLNNKYLIDYLIEKVNEIPEIQTIYILSNNKFYINFLEWRDNFKYLTNKKIKIINNGVDKDIHAKGALKDLKFVLKIIDYEELLILGSDNLYCLDLKKIIEKGREKQSSVSALKKIDNKELIKKYSCILLDDENKIISFQEKPQNPKSDLVSIFCYYLTKQDLEKIKSHESYETENIIEFLHDKTNVYGNLFSESWFDVGSLEELKKAERYLIEESKHL